MSIICPACNAKMDDVTTRCVCGYELDILRGDKNFRNLREGEKSPGNIILRDIINGVEMIIPAKTSPFVVVFFGLATLCWAIVESLLIWVAFTTISIPGLSDGEILLLVFAAVWTIIGGFVITRWLWILGGREIIVLNHSHLTIKKDMYGFGYKRIYDLNNIKNFCVSYEGGEREANQWGGAILFDYDSDTFRFGLSINEEEAKFIVSELNKRHYFRAG